MYICSSVRSNIFILVSEITIVVAAVAVVVVVWYLDDVEIAGTGTWVTRFLC